MFLTLPQTLKEALMIVWKNKIITLLLMILHLIFIAGLGIMTFTYVATLTTSYQAVGEHLAQTAQSVQDLEQYAQGFDIEGKNDPTEALEAGEKIESAKMGLEEAREAMTKGTFKLLTLFGIFYIFIAGINWSLTHKIIKKDTMKGTVNYFKKFVIVSLPSTILVLSILYYLSNAANKQLFLNKPANEYIAGTLFIILLMVIYLMYFFYTHIGKKVDEKWVKQMLWKGVKKFPYIGAVLLISLIIVSVPYVLVDWMMDNDMSAALIIVSFILAPLLIVYGRIFYYKALHKI